MTRDEAERIVAALVAKHHLELAVDRAATIERDWGFVVFYATRAFLEGDEGAVLFGGGPYLVTHEHGVFSTGSRLPAEDWEAGLMLEIGRVPAWRWPFAALGSAWLGNRPHRVPDEDVRLAITYRR